MSDTALSQFADVDQPFDPSIDQAGKSPKVHQLGDPSLDDLADLIGVVNDFPRLGNQPAQTQSDAAPIGVDTQNLHLDLFTDLHHFAGVGDPIPAQFAQMDQAVCTAQVHKSAEIGDAADQPFHHQPFAQRLQQLVLLLAAPIPHCQPFREDQAVALAVDVDHLEFEQIPHQRGIAGVGILLAVDHRSAGQLAGGHKASHLPKAHDHPSPVEGIHRALEDLLALHQPLGPFPVLLSQCTADTQLHIAVSIFAKDEHRHRVSHRQGLQRLADPLILTPGDNPFRLKADVHQNLVRSLVDHDSGADLSRDRLLQRTIDLIQQGCHRVILVIDPSSQPALCSTRHASNFTHTAQNPPRTKYNSITRVVIHPTIRSTRSQPAHFWAMRQPEPCCALAVRG